MPKTEIGKISTVIKCNNHIARITINFNLILQLESLLCVNATRMRSSVLWPGSAPITVERYCHQNNPKMPPLITFGGNNSYPPTHTTFSPEFFVDCWLVKSHEVHTVVVVSADASGFEKECRSPVQWGGGGGLSADCQQLHAVGAR